MNRAYITRQDNGLWTVITDIRHRIGETFQCRSQAEAERLARLKNHIVLMQAAKWDNLGLQAANQYQEDK